MTTKLQLKLRGIFLADDVPEILTNPVGDIFSMFFSAVGNFFLYLIGLIINPICHLFSTVVSAVSNFFSTVITAVGNFFQYLVGLIINPICHVVSAVSNFFSTIVSGVSSFFFFTWFNQQIFSKVVFTVTNLYQHLINWFNQQFPPETRDDQIRCLIIEAIPYLIGAAHLITCLCCWQYTFPIISSIVVGCFKTVVCLFSCIRCIVVGCLKTVFSCIHHIVDAFLKTVSYVVDAFLKTVSYVFSGICYIVVGCFVALRSFYLFIFPCLRSGTAVMMKAPGQPFKLISRAAFEANPVGYFRGLRGLPTNFVC